MCSYGEMLAGNYIEINMELEQNNLNFKILHQTLPLWIDNINKFFSTDLLQFLYNDWETCELEKKAKEICILPFLLFGKKTGCKISRFSFLAELIKLI